VGRNQDWHRLSALGCTGTTNGRKNRVMKSSRVLALALAVVLSSGSAPTALFAQAPPPNASTIAGTARAEAKKPYENYTVRVRDMLLGTVRATTQLDSQGNFVLPNLAAAQYTVELVNKDGRLVCTEGPFDVAPQMIKNDVVINCGRFPAAIILLTGAGAAGITAGILAASGPTSAAQ
jgi:hypothetical protein